MSNPIVHFETVGPNESDLHGFYHDLCGWDIRPTGPGYALVETPKGTPNGAVREGEQPELTIGIGVDDLDTSISVAVRSGATVLMPATDNGYVNKAQIVDPAGNVVTLIENSKRAD